MSDNSREMLLKSPSVGDHGVRLVSEGQTLYIRDIDTDEDFAVFR